MSLLLGRNNQTALGQWWWTIDRHLFFSILILIGCGLVMVSAASPSVAARIGLDEFHFIKRHIFFLVPSLIMMVGLSFCSKEWVRRFAILMFLGALVGVLMTLIMGYEIKGAQRWIRVLGFSVQPSEFLKPAFVMVAAWLMAKQKQDLSFPGNRITVGVFALCLLLLVLQPDMGMSILLTSIWATQIFLAGLPFFWVFVIGGAGVLGLLSAYFFLPHFQSRMDRFLNPESGDTYQIDKAMEAFSNGGLTGVGPGEGVVKLSIPDAHADFVFAVAGEEMGLVFLLFVIAVYGYIMWRGFLQLRQNQDLFVVLAASGLLVMVGLQAFIHMGANLHILPTKGMTLPFISYGGSSVIALGISMGMLLSITRKTSRA